MNKTGGVGKASSVPTTMMVCVFTIHEYMYQERKISAGKEKEKKKKRELM